MSDFHSLVKRGTVSITLDGERLTAPSEMSIAASLLLAGRPVGRLSVGSNVQRSPYCMIGHCFECTMTIDKVPYQQTCIRRIVDGMVITSQIA